MTIHLFNSINSISDATLMSPTITPTVLEYFLQRNKALWTVLTYFCI